MEHNIKREIINGIYYENGMPKHAGVIKIEEDIYYAGKDGVLATGEKTVHTNMTNRLISCGLHNFGPDGKLVVEKADITKSGIFEEAGKKYFYNRGMKIHAGVISVDGKIYYASHNGEIIVGKKQIHSGMTNGLIASGIYEFGQDGVFVEGSFDQNKNGVFEEEGKLIYYKNGIPVHAGVVKVGEDIYYASHKGEIVTGKKQIHSGMGHQILEKGTYTFGKDGKLIKGSFKPKKESKNSKSRKRKAFLKNRKFIIAITSALVLVLLVGGYYIKENYQAKNNAIKAEKIESDIISVPAYADEVYLCTPAVQEFFEGKITLQQAVTNNSGNKNGAYQGFEFKYHIKNTDAKVTLYVDENKDFVNSEIYDLDVFNRSVVIDNLDTGKEYYYKITAELSNKTEEYLGCFKTANINRFITLPNAKNTRDIGGYTTDSGKTVKKGMLIRGTEIDGLVEGSYFLTDATVAEKFGFVYDFDLRESNIFSGEYVSRLGKNVRHKFYSSPAYGGVFNKNSHETLRNIFADLAKPENYPMYLHCTYGVDRTGTIVFLLQGVLGVSDEDMEKEYRLTGLFSSSYANGTDINAVIGGLEGASGNTYSEKVVNYLTGTVGVPKENIEKIRAILLEK